MSSPSPYTLTILTRGHRYTEPYQTLCEALDAANELCSVRRERAESIVDADGTLRLEGDELAQVLVAVCGDRGRPRFGRFEPGLDAAWPRRRRATTQV